jgi:hypothetical protein
MPRAIRSFMLPVGLAPSHFAHTSAPPAGSNDRSRTSGVLPTATRPAAVITAS